MIRGRTARRGETIQFTLNTAVLFPATQESPRRELMIVRIVVDLDGKRWDMSDRTKHGRIYALLCKGWRSVRHAERRDVLTFDQRVSELRTKIGPADGFRVVSRWERGCDHDHGTKRVKQHRIVHHATEKPLGDQK